MTPFSSKEPIVNADRTASRSLIAFFQGLFSGVIPRTVYTYAQIAQMDPTLGVLVICSDSSVVTIGNTLAGGGANIVQAVGNGTAWKVI